METINIIIPYISILFLLIALILTGLKEGWRERERQVFQDFNSSPAEYKKCQKKWHNYGAIQRLFIGLALLVLMIPDWYEILLWISVVLWFAWVMYDGMTNMPKDLSTIPGTKRWYQKFFYSGSVKTGTGSKTDQILGEYLPFIKLIYTLLLPVLIIMYLTLEVFNK